MNVVMFLNGPVLFLIEKNKKLLSLVHDQINQHYAWRRNKFFPVRVKIFDR